LRAVPCLPDHRAGHERAARAGSSHAAAAGPLSRISRDGEGVMDATGARFTADRIGEEFRVVHQGFREEVAGLDAGALNWRPHPEANSIAILVTHTLGSEKEMLRAVAGRGYERGVQ